MSIADDVDPLVPKLAEENIPDRPVGVLPPTRVVAVLPVHNRRALTVQAVVGLRRMDLRDIELDIVVVDDGSSDGTSEAVQAVDSRAFVIRGDGNLWYSGGMNLGLAKALELGPDFILAANDDSVFHRELLRRLVRLAGSRPCVAAPAVLRWDATATVMQCRPTWSTWRGGWQWPQDLTISSLGGEPFEVGFVPGNCVLIPRVAVETVGLMDRERFPHWGDAEYFPRLRRAGWPLVVEPTARVWVKPNAAARSLRSMGPRKALRALLQDRYSPHNLTNELLADWYSAPSRIAGVTAFAVSLARRGARLMGGR